MFTSSDQKAIFVVGKLLTENDSMFTSSDQKGGGVWMPCVSINNHPI